MTREERAARVRPVVAREVGKTNLRAVASRAKISHGTFAQLINGSVPHANTLARIEKWIQEEGLVVDEPPASSVQDKTPPSAEARAAMVGGSERVLRQIDAILAMDVSAAEKMELLRVHQASIRAATAQGEVVAAERRAQAAIAESQAAEMRVAPSGNLIVATDAELAKIAAQGHELAAAVAAAIDAQRQAV